MLKLKSIAEFEEICKAGLLMSTQVIADADLLLSLGDSEMTKRGVLKQDVKDLITLAKSVKTTYVFALNAIHKEDFIEFIALLQQALELTDLLERTLDAIDSLIKEDENSETEDVPEIKFYEPTEKEKELIKDMLKNNSMTPTLKFMDDKYKEEALDTVKEFVSKAIFEGLGIPKDKIKIIPMEIDKEE